MLLGLSMATSFATTVLAGYGERMVRAEQRSLLRAAEVAYDDFKNVRSSFEEQQHLFHENGLKVAWLMSFPNRYDTVCRSLTP